MTEQIQDGCEMPRYCLCAPKGECNETIRPQRGYARVLRVHGIRFQERNQSLEACCGACFRLNRASLLRIRVVAGAGALGKIHIEIERQKSRRLGEGLPRVGVALVGRIRFMSWIDHEADGRSLNL